MSWFRAQRIHRMPLSPEERKIIDEACYAAVERAICPRPATHDLRVNKVA